MHSSSGPGTARTSANAACDARSKRTSSLHLRAVGSGLSQYAAFHRHTGQRHTQTNVLHSLRAELLAAHAALLSGLVRLHPAGQHLLHDAKRLRRPPTPSDQRPPDEPPPVCTPVCTYAVSPSPSHPPSQLQSLAMRNVFRGQGQGRIVKKAFQSHYWCFKKVIAQHGQN